MHEQLHEYVGVIHIHSTYSDGSRPIPEIAAIAAEVDLDWYKKMIENFVQGAFGLSDLTGAEQRDLDTWM